jgi:hypothetical protein
MSARKEAQARSESARVQDAASRVVYDGTVQRRLFRTLLLSLAGLSLTACPSSPPASDGGIALDTGGADAFSADVGSDTRADTGPMALPDLTVDADQLASNVQFARMYFPADSCEITEACVSAPGWRTLLMFTTYTPNIGTADLVLGSNTLPGGGTNPNFEYSTCHMHYHFRGYADYTLLNLDGTTAAQGHKQSFCVEDLERVDTTTPGIRSSPHYGNCGDGTSEQGISRGWADDYYPDLPCQWIDVTDVAPGTYTLHVALNTMHGIVESDYTNDTGEAMVTIPADYAAGADPTTACTASDPYEGSGRNCGWHREGVHTCTPGQHLSVGCNAGCGVGSCDDSNGGYDIRICRGDMNCRSADAVNLIAADFGECGTGRFDLASDCGVARFDCPAEGMYTTLVAAEWTPEANPLLGCHLATMITP